MVLTGILVTGAMAQTTETETGDLQTSPSESLTTSSVETSETQPLIETATSQTQELAVSDEKVSETLITPVPNVLPMKMSAEWEKRFRDMGVSPESFWRLVDAAETPEEQDALKASQYYFMGWYYLESGHAGRATEQFSKALEEDPDNPHILLDAARARLAVKEISEARDLIVKVLDKYTTNVEALRLQAETYLLSADSSQGDEKENQIKQAVESLEKARAIQPNNLEVLRTLAKAYILQQNVNNVIGTYREIVKVDPRDTYSLLVLAQVLSRMDRPEEAIEYYQRVIEQRRGFIGGYIYLGQLYERLKRYSDALNLYKQALLVEPRNEDLLRRFEDVLRQVNGSANTAKVLEAYKKFVDEYPANTEVRRIYAERLAGERKTDEAIAQYNRILEIDPENSDTLMELGKIYSEQKDYTKAAEMLTKAVDVNPDKVDLYDAIASTFLAREEKAEAIALYRKAIEANPNAEKLYISLAALLEDDNKSTDAVHVMEQAVSKVGEKPELLAVLGKFYRSLGNIEKAERTLRKAYDKESDNLPLYGELLSLYLSEKKTSAAEEITSKTFQAAPTAKDLVLSVGAELYFNAGMPEKSREMYQQALDINSSKLDYLARLVYITNGEKQYSESLAYLEKFGGRIKDQDKVKRLKGDVLLAAGRSEEALTIYRELLRENPYDLEYYELLVDAHNYLKQYDKSMEIVQEAQQKIGSKQDNAAVSILMMKGMVLYKQKKFTEAEQIFKELVRKTGDKNGDAVYILGSIYLDQEKFEKAEKEFRKAIEINPNSANALNALGFMFADRNIKLDEARELITKALDINPNATHILDSMGWVLYRQGDLAGAVEYIEKAAKPQEDPEILGHLGEVYAKQGKKELARKAYMRALELDSKRDDLKKKLQELGNGAAKP